MCRNIIEMIYKSLAIAIFLHIYNVGMMYRSLGVIVGCAEEVIIPM